MKVWLTTIALGFAVVQLLSALWMYGRLPLGAAPSWLGTGAPDLGQARIPADASGRLPLSVPARLPAFEHAGTPAFDLGCLFYGAFAAKVLVVRSRGLPASVLPLVGGLVFLLLVYIWLLSGLWYIDQFGFPAR